MDHKTSLIFAFAISLLAGWVLLMSSTLIIEYYEDDIGLGLSKSWKIFMKVCKYYLAVPVLVFVFYIKGLKSNSPERNWKYSYILLFLSTICMVACLIGYLWPILLSGGSLQS